jgi:hypothetical protein
VKVVLRPKGGHGQSDNHKVGRAPLSGHRFGTSELCASRRAAVGLAGCAPHLVPSRGHPALIPDVSGPWRACALRLPALWRSGGGLAVSLHGRTAFTPSRAARACALAAWPSSPPDCLRCAVRAPVPGNAARATGARSCRTFLPLANPRCWCATHAVVIYRRQRTRFYWRLASGQFGCWR